MSSRILSEKFQAELGRSNYVTPTSYLELIGTLKALLNKKKDEVASEFGLIRDEQSMRTQRLKNRNLEKDSHNANYDDVVSGRRRVNEKDDAFYGITSEMFNF